MNFIFKVILIIYNLSANGAKFQGKSTARLVEDAINP
jgi:hypothetical protein